MVRCMVTPIRATLKRERGSRKQAPTARLPHAGPCQVRRNEVFTSLEGGCKPLAHGADTAREARPGAARSRGCTPGGVRPGRCALHVEGAPRAGPHARGGPREQALRAGGSPRARALHAGRGAYGAASKCGCASAARSWLSAQFPAPLTGRATARSSRPSLPRHSPGAPPRGAGNCATSHNPPAHAQPANRGNPVGAPHVGGRATGTGRKDAPPGRAQPRAPLPNVLSLSTSR